MDAEEAQDVSPGERASGPDPAGSADQSGPRIGRRQFASLVAGAAGAGLAGCAAMEFGETVDDAELDGSVLRALALGEPPRQADLNTFGGSGGATVLRRFLEALVLPVDASTGAFHVSGHTHEVDGREVPVPCLVADFEIDAPEAVRLTLDDRFTYWDGTPMDAAALRDSERLAWLADGRALLGESFHGEVLGPSEYRREVSWYAPANHHGARTLVHPAGNAPAHPEFTAPHVERLGDATTEEALEEARTTLVQDEVGPERFASEGYGSGAYALESVEDVRNDAVILRRRDDHPGVADADNVVLRLAGAPGRAVPIVRGGSADVGLGTVGTDRAFYLRGDVPDSIQSVVTYRDPGLGGRQLVFNHARRHVGRLPVRRALVARLPLGELAALLWGDNGAPPRYRTGMLSRADERVLGRSFCESLYEYPLAADPATAREWLREGGYERDGDRWVGPDGDVLALSVHFLGAAHSEVGEVLATELGDFGVPTTLETERLVDYEAILGAGEFDLTLGISPGSRSPVDYYGNWLVSQPYVPVGADSGGAPQDPMVSPPFLPVEGAVERGRHEDDLLPERVTVPETAGALWIDGVDYAADGDAYAHPGDVGRDVALAERVAVLRDDDADPETTRDVARLAARWHNYALPSVVLAQTVVGLWTDVEDVEAPSDESVLRLAPQDHPDPTHYHLQAGTVRPRSED